MRDAATVTGATIGYDGDKKISGRKTFGMVDTNGLLVAVGVFPACVSDNYGGINIIDAARTKIDRFRHVWIDGGFKRTFIEPYPMPNVTSPGR